MCRCPSCDARIRFRTILFALCPVWLRCPACGTRLVGNRFVKAQSVVVLATSLAVGIPLGVWVAGDSTTLPTRALVGFGIVVAWAVALGVPMTVLTVRRGGYAVREKRVSGESEAG